MEHTRNEKRLQRLTLVAAFFCFVISIIDILNIVPGIGGKMMPLLIGILILYLLPLGQSINRTRRNAAAIQQKVTAHPGKPGRFSGYAQPNGSRYRLTVASQPSARIFKAAFTSRSTTRPQ